MPLNPISRGKAIACLLDSVSVKDPSDASRPASLLYDTGSRMLVKKCMAVVVCVAWALGPTILLSHAVGSAISDLRAERAAAAQICVKLPM